MTDFVRAPWETPFGVYSVLITAPADEPISVEEAKLRAGLGWPEEDPREQLMAEYIKAARGKVELDTGLALLTQTREVYFYLDPAHYTGLVPLPQQCSPVQSLEDITPGAVTRARRPLRVTGQLAEAPAPTGVYRIVAGWPDPATLKLEAPLLVQAVGLLAAHYATFGRDLAISGAVAVVPAGYEDAIASHRLVWVA